MRPLHRIGNDGRSSELLIPAHEVPIYLENGWIVTDLPTCGNVRVVPPLNQLSPACSAFALKFANVPGGVDG